MRVSSLALVAVLPAAMGCTGTVSSANGDGVDAEPVSTTSALVSIERSYDVAAGSRAETSARFLRVLGASSSADALRAIGAALDLPAAGTCAALSSRNDESLGALPLVELVDVGGVTIEAAGIETRMSPRQLPDVTDVVSGVLYARATEAALLPDSTTYVVRVAGSAGFEPFTVAASAPGDPLAVRIAGEDTSGAGTLAIAGPNLEITWPATGSGGGDVVYVDVRPASVRCTLGDQGYATISTLLLDDTGTLVVHRLRRESLQARGVDSGEVRFDFARTVAYVRR